MAAVNREGTELKYGIITLGITALFLWASGSAQAQQSPTVPNGQQQPRTSPMSAASAPPATRARFPVHFYMVAMIFILFDIEAIFLYP